jgi:hypothetical protein
MDLEEQYKRPEGILVLIWNDERPEIYHNLIVDAGLLKLGDILAGAETMNLTLPKFGAGSGSGKVAYTDTKLETAIGKISGQSAGYPVRDGNILKNAWQVGTTQLKGTWREVGIFFADNVMWSHVNVAEREKTGEDVVSVWYFVSLII